MNIPAMKHTLAQKLKEEHCYFTEKDIIIKKPNPNEYRITLKGYEPYSFKMILDEPDEFFGYMVFINQYYNNEFEEIVASTDNKKDYDIKNALIELGFYIGTRF